ncbi:hypothetical protein PG993_003174 [Apiospora rasikravindrae]|uniref:Uncharacterized protein n=1 Tax=Apiospora rasikravindrae TaxID=990691 RepID=A0ABR1TYT1_9PEZI
MVTGQNLGPLTAAPTLPSTCADELGQVYKIHTPPGYYLLQGPPEGASCYPSAYAGVRSQYYSPAASCPFGFTPACTSTEGESETVYTCCPTQFNYGCQSTILFEWETTLGCMIPINFYRATTWTILDVQDGRTVTSTSSGSQGGMNAFSIQVRFQSSDLITSGPFGKASWYHEPLGNSFEIIIRITRAKQTSTASPTKGPSNDSNMASNTDIASASNGSGGLTAGAAAGITVGAVALFLAIASAILMTCRRRRRRRKVQPANQLPDSCLPSPDPKYVSGLETASQTVYEAPNNTYYELEGTGQRSTT